MSTPSSAGKICVMCGEDVSAKPRTKDAKGRYYCQPCYQKVTQQKQARREAMPLPKVPPPPRDDGPLGLDDAGPSSMLEKLLADEKPAAHGRPCPGCGANMAESAIICTSCGYNFQSGQRLDVKTIKVKEPSAFAPSGLAGLLLSPAVVGLILLAAFGGFAALAWGDPPTTLAYLGINGLFNLGVGITVLVFAFRESIGTGFLTLCVPCYSLYFVYGINDNQWVRVLFGVSLITQVIGIPMRLEVDDQLSSNFGSY